jgi:flagellar biosynthesis chaperone FliJ
VGNNKGEGLYSIRYAEFVVPLVKAVQEQQYTIEQQQKTINELKQELSEMQILKEKLHEIEKKLAALK